MKTNVLSEAEILVFRYQHIKRQILPSAGPPLELVRPSLILFDRSFLIFDSSGQIGIIIVSFIYLFKL